MWAASALACALAALAPASGFGATMTFGSPLSAPASVGTGEGLGYYGTYTNVPPSPEVPTGVVHTAHWGADTALWNTAISGAGPTAPASGQALKVSLEGCAQQASGGPVPLHQIHFQALTPLAGGGAVVDLTSQAFDIPVCGEAGAGYSTVTTYEPTNLCVSAGDVVDFNDEGGFVEPFYRAGVSYHVIGSTEGSTMDSFIRNNGTGNGATISPHDTTANDGFASNPGEELMLQVVEGTGADASHNCAGGSAGLPKPAYLPPLHIRPQTDGINASRVVSVAIYCRPAAGCSGSLRLAMLGRAAIAGHALFHLPGNKTSHVPVQVSAGLLGQIRRRHGVSVAVTATLGTQVFTQTISIKIL